MNRDERRRRERNNRIENRKGKIPLSRGEIKAIKDDAFQSATEFNVEALMTCFVLAERRLYGFGPKRIERSLKCIDELMGDIINDVATLDDYRRELEDEAGIIIKCD